MVPQHGSTDANPENSPSNVEVSPAGGSSTSSKVLHALQSKWTATVEDPNKHVVEVIDYVSRIHAAIESQDVQMRLPALQEFRDFAMCHKMSHKDLQSKYEALGDDDVDYEISSQVCK